jgi:hypothetical protein
VGSTHGRSGSGSGRASVLTSRAIVHGRARRRHRSGHRGRPRRPVASTRCRPRSARASRSAAGP